MSPTHHSTFPSDARRIRSSGLRAASLSPPSPPGSPPKPPRPTTFGHPDISFFHGLFHLYYAASFLGSQASVIGLLTTPTLDRADPTYAWTDHGPLLASHPGNNFNTIDPNIFIHIDQRVWLTYGSYWSGIMQREIDTATGLLAANATRYHLATRTTSPDNAIESSSLVQHNGFYFLFFSVDHCCAAHLAEDNYKQVVGRSLSPHRPFVDALGTPLLQNGGSILLEANAAHPAGVLPVAVPRT